MTLEQYNEHMAQLRENKTMSVDSNRLPVTTVNEATISLERALQLMEQYPDLKQAYTVTILRHVWLLEKEKSYQYKPGFWRGAKRGIAKGDARLAFQKFGEQLYAKTGYDLGNMANIDVLFRHVISQAHAWHLDVEKATAERWLQKAEQSQNPEFKAAVRKTVDQFLPETKEPEDEAQAERDRVQCQKYEQAMAEKRQAGNFAELNEKIFESATFSADPTIKYLRSKLGGQTDEFKKKFVLVMFEFLYFFIHLANRSAFAQLGAENSLQLSQKLVEHLVGSMVETLMGHWPNNLRQGMKNDFCNNYNTAEGDYARCRAIYLSPEEDTKTEEKLANGEKSKSMVGQLVDNVSEILTGKVNMDPFLLLTVSEGVTSMLKKNMKEIDALIMAWKFNS